MNYVPYRYFFIAIVGKAAVELPPSYEQHGRSEQQALRGEGAGEG